MYDISRRTLVVVSDKPKSDGSVVIVNRDLPEYGVKSSAALQALSNRHAYSASPWTAISRTKVFARAAFSAWSVHSLNLVAGGEQERT